VAAAQDLQPTACGQRAKICNPQSAIVNPQSAIVNPQSQSPIRNLNPQSSI